MSASVAELAAACLLCDGEAWQGLVTGYDRMTARGGDYAYVRCGGCGLVRQSPLPDADAIAGFYDEAYHRRIEAWPRRLDKPVNRLAVANFYGVESVARPAWMRACFRALSGRILAGVLEPHGDNRLLDIGCGSGATLDVHRRLGWQVQGIEPHAGAVAACRARDLPVHHGTVFDAPLAPRFDVVLLSHVIEHVPDPVALLDRARGFLAAHGKLLVLTPNALALGFRLYRSCWFGLDAPRHLHLFDPRTIRRLARRAGLRARAVRTRTPRNMLRESRHLAETQTQIQPAGLAARAALIAASTRPVRRYRAYLAATAPLVFAAERLGRGEILAAELGADDRG